MRYSEVYPISADSRTGCRYNYARGALERVSKSDSFNGKPAALHFINWVVMDSVGLSLREWNADPRYWVDRYSGEAAGQGAMNHLGWKIAM